MSYLERKNRLIKELSEAKGQGVALGKSTSNLFRHRQQGQVKRINVRDFNHVLKIDPENLIAEVEGMTPYETLTRATLKYNLMPAVVPELKSITVGGATTGVGIESSSFKYGLVHETILEMDILLASGQVITCNKDQNPDLFYGFPNSYGTFGYALKLKVKLIPVKKYVKLTHLKFNNSKDYFDKFKDLPSCDFVDGTIFSEDEMYLTLGNFTDEAEEVSDYTHLKIYYKSIAQKKVDYLKTYDYIWRWDTDWFWCSKHVGAQNKIIRRLLGKQRLNSIFYSKLRKWNNYLPFKSSKTESVIQDVEIPLENCVDFIEFFHQEIGIKPVWVCPLIAHHEHSLYPMELNKLYLNFGFWDVVKSNKEPGYYNRLIEKKVRELGGKKSLYSDVFYSKEEFWQLYNQPVYDKLKKKYDPDHHFLDLFQKCGQKK